LAARTASHHGARRSPPEYIAFHGEDKARRHFESQDAAVSRIATIERMSALTATSEAFPAGVAQSPADLLNRPGAFQGTRAGDGSD
jgi:hypothetical protein